ncbi:hypothetical protein Y032_0015g2883 [Ancylostoma ceylanicum]|uniref:Uncharacterized protein n=1 Tax=Ancylostoma ceylanicum TaxID=53326 RepID=A0A016V8U9_9BILA|nr:hypothetical protein Y032_0015g2883 [Ancylostoma ceylanicum]
MGLEDGSLLEESYFFHLSAAFNEVDPLDRENSLTVMSLNAQTIALQLLRRTQEWTGDKTDPSLLAYDKKAIDQIIKQTYDRGPVKITRNATDRVTSILTWEANKLVDAVLMMELSLPHIAVVHYQACSMLIENGRVRDMACFTAMLWLRPFTTKSSHATDPTPTCYPTQIVFDPTGGTGKRVEYAPFVHENGEKSIQFSSTAGVMIVQTTRGVPKALMAASASGSERTVEGVANAILRMLILKKGAGVAVGTLDAYVDHKDGRSHCTHSVSETLKFLFNYKCDSHDHQKPKRTIMAAEAGSQAPQITLALSQEFGGYNYASGY